VQSDNLLNATIVTPDTILAWYRRRIASAGF
jgi:hypothetical protein